MATTKEYRSEYGKQSYVGKSSRRSHYKWRPVPREKLLTSLYPHITVAEYPHINTWETRSDITGYSSVSTRDESGLDLKHGVDHADNKAHNASAPVSTPAFYCCGCSFAACNSCYSNLGGYTHTPIRVLDATDLESIVRNDFMVQDGVVATEGEVNTADENSVAEPSVVSPCNPMPQESKEREVKDDHTMKGESHADDTSSTTPPSDPEGVLECRLSALIPDAPAPPPLSDPTDGDPFDSRFERLMKEGPVPPDVGVPVAPVIENLPAMEAELAALIVKNKLSSGLHDDEKKVDPPIHLEALPSQFKVRRDVPWFTKMYHKLFGCCTTQVATTRHYSLEGLQLSDFHINGLDVRATNALSHTMLRQEPQIVRISVVPYDQFDNVMPVYERDPVTWAQGMDVGRSVIHVPLVLIADMMRKFMATDAVVGDLHTMYQDLVKVINVPYNEFMSSEPDFVMFGLDLMTWLKQRRRNDGLLNFHPNQST